jgi:hypothetical protein
MSLIRLAGLDWPVILMKAAGYVVSVGLVGGGFAWFTHSQREHGREEIRRQWGEQRAAEQAEAMMRAAYIRNDQEKTRKEADNALAQAHMDRDLAAAAAGRMRQQLAAFRAAHAGAAASAPAGDPAGDPIGVLADVLGRADERQGELASYADAARIAGLACERSYHALMPRDDMDGGRIEH